MLDDVIGFFVTHTYGLTSRSKCMKFVTNFLHRAINGSNLTDKLDAVFKW